MSEPENQPVRGFYFWSLSPFLVVFVVLLPLLIEKRDTRALIVLVDIETLATLVLLGLFNPLRFWWAWRGVGGIIFLGYLAYLVDMLVESGGKISITPTKSQSSPFSAILGVIVFGLPGLRYALFGKLPFRGKALDDDTDASEGWDAGPDADEEWDRDPDADKSET